MAAAVVNPRDPARGDAQVEGRVPSHMSRRAVVSGPVTRTIGSAAVAAVGSWLVLIAVLGNVGLQQTMSLGPLRPDGVIVAYGAMGLVATVAGYLGAPGATIRAAAPGVVALLAMDLVGAVVATFLIGELGLADLPAVMTVITGVGLQPLGFLVGSTIAGWRASAG
jgi:hypothetical protein